MNKGRLLLIQEHIKEYLKENLKVEIEHTKHDIGYFDSWVEDDPNNFKVTVTLEGEIISESYTS